MAVDARVEMAQTAGPSRLRWWGWMTGTGVVALLVSVPFLMKSLAQSPAVAQAPIPLGVLVALQVVQASVLTALAVWLGVVLAPKVGLDAPLFRARAAGEPVAGRLLRLVPRMVGWGTVAALAAFAVALAFRPVLPEALKRPLAPPSLLSVTSAAYGGVVEELHLRWGLMTLLFWALLRLLRLPRGAAFWAANVGAALLFGAAHLPAAAMLTPLTPAVVAYILAGNFVVGVVAGALYRKHGIEAAMVAHGTADLWLHLVLPLAALLWVGAA